MIAVDLDGTLIGAEGKVSPRNLAALHAAIAAGVEVVIATGRRHSYAMRVLRALELAGANVLVSSNGTVTRTIGATLIDRTLLPAKTTLWLCEHLKEFRNAMVITYDLVQPHGDDAHGALIVEELEDLHSSIGKWMEANAPYIEQSLPIEAVINRRAALGEAPIQMMLCGTIERMRRAEARLLEDQRVFSSGITPPERLASAEIALSRTEYPERDLSLLDILPATCSKGVALLRLAACRSIEPSEIMAIGDNWNDLSMLEIVGRPVLMANAPADLKELAATKGWQIGGHHLHDGVADAIHSVLRLQPSEPLGVEEEAVLSGSLNS
jgi:HAD superfamily hydrolase (TIGR01484 family)